MDSSHISDEQLIAYAAKELNDIDSVLVRDHIAGCAVCNATVGEFKYIRGLMRSDYSQEPPPAALARAYAIFDLPQPAIQPERVSPNWLEFFQLTTRRLFAPAMTVLALVLVLVLSRVTVLAADNSLPGDFLYPMKINVEGLQLALAADKSDQANLLLGFADTRVSEIGMLKDKGAYDHIGTTMYAYEKEVDQATNLLEDLATTNPNSASTVGGVTVELIANHTAVLTQLMSQVPPQARGAIQHAIDVSQKDKSKALNALQSIPPKGNPSAPPRATNTPTATPTRTRTPTPLDGLSPREDKTPPGQIKTPPGQINTPPGQIRTPPGQINTPGPGNTPPGQVNTPPGQIRTPPGQVNTPPGQNNPNPTKANKQP